MALMNNTHLLIVIISFWLVACVSVTTVEPERDKYLSFSCEELQQALRDIGAIHDDAEGEQGLTATQAFGDALTLGIARPVNMTRAKNAERNAEEQIKLLYEIWDEKKCSSMMYEKNKKEALTSETN